MQQPPSIPCPRCRPHDNGAMEAKPKRRWYQFSLRTLLIAVTMLAIVSWTILSQLRLIEERDEARIDAENQKRLAENQKRLAENQKRLAESWRPAVAPSNSRLPGGPGINGFVPDQRTAVRIAIAVWGPIYGDDTIAGEKPFVARLSNGVWIVEGSLPDGWDGGTAYIEINKADGKVLKVTHYR